MPGTSWRVLLILPAAALLLACGTPTPVPNAPAGDDWAGWSEQPLPGKAPTRYVAGKKAGKAALHARADRSVSLWRKRLPQPLDPARQITFEWWLDSHLPMADIAKIGATDAPVRVMVAFDGDRSKLPLRTRMMMDLAHALTGEEPPYATLVYVWDTERAPESVVQHPRSDRVRKIVVESGQARLGQWLSYRRDLKADYRRAFGEDPGPVVGLMVMTDSDNTGSNAQAWYGPVRLD